MEVWGFHGIELTIRLIRFAAAVVVGLVVGIVSSSLLAMIAAARGFNGDLVFNVSGLLITLLACIILVSDRA
jgi:hypothetical protein